MLKTFKIQTSTLKTRNDITALAFYDQHGSDTILSPQCNSWKVIHFPTHNIGLQRLLLHILQ